MAGQWDTVNGEVLRCPAVQASMDHDHQLECHTISDVKPVDPKHVACVKVNTFEMYRTNVNISSVKNNIN